MAGAALWAYKVRSLFVTAAVALGIASLTVIVAAVDGAQRKAEEIVEWFGPEAAMILGGDLENRPVGQRTNTLTWQDAESLRRSLPGAYLVVPMRSKGDLTVRHEGKSMVVGQVVGSTENYAEAWNWPLSEGRDISEEDVVQGAKICLVGENVAQELFGDGQAVGKVIFVQKIPFQVVGRLTYRGVSGGHTPVDERLVIPITTLTKRFNLDRKYFRGLRIKFLDPENMSEHVRGLREYLRELHRLKDTDKDDFTVITADEILKFMSMLKGSLILFLGVTAAAAMLAGGFVLANLFYLSVSERAVEIGIKKALGARSRAIMAQFLAEAVALTALGALLGLVLGLAMGQTLERLGVMEIKLSLKIFVLALAASTAIGLVFGLRPARRAADLDPIQALRGGE